jgi:hypothetical protein
MERPLHCYTEDKISSNIFMNPDSAIMFNFLMAIPTKELLLTVLTSNSDDLLLNCFAQRTYLFSYKELSIGPYT